jgi:hypothetical protein
LVRQLSRGLDRGQHPVRVVFAFLYVRLIERLDTEDMTGDGRRELPPEKLSPQLIAVPKIELDYRLPARGQFAHTPIEHPIPISLETQIHKDAVRSVG